MKVINYAYYLILICSVILTLIQEHPKIFRIMKTLILNIIVLSILLLIFKNPITLFEFIENQT